MSHQKRYTASDKVKILREHLQSGISISELSRKYGVHPNVIMNWRKKLFEGASDIFSGSRGKKTKKGEEHINNLREEVNRKDKIISRLTEEILTVKKNIAGNPSENSGWTPI